MDWEFLVWLLLENQPRSRPETLVNNDALDTLVEVDTSQTMRELAAKFDALIPNVLDHLNQIGKVKKPKKWVSHELNEHQMTHCLQTFGSLLYWHKSKPFLHHIFMCDEKIDFFQQVFCMVVG